MRIPHEGGYQFHLVVGGQNKIKTLERRLARYEGDEALQKARADADKWRRRYDCKAAGHKKALRLHDKECERRVRCWQEAAEDVNEENIRLKAELAALKEENAALKAQIAKQAAELEDRDAYDETLKHRLGMNSENSSIPSSQDRFGTKQTKSNNSSTKTGRSRGAQSGHPHHSRKILEPNHAPVYLTDRPAGTESDDWYMTESFVEKLLVGIRVSVPGTPYRAMIWRNRITGATKTSPFPYGMHDEVCYLPELKTFVIFCTQYLNVAGRKVKELLYEGTDGILKVSAGWINQLVKEFKAKSQEEIAELFQRLLRSDVMGVDSTVKRITASGKPLPWRAVKTLHFLSIRRTRGKRRPKSCRALQDQAIRES